MNGDLSIAGFNFKNRLFLGTGKFSSNSIMKKTVEESLCEVVTVAVRRIDFSNNENIVSDLPEKIKLLPNTSGARNAEEAIRIAKLARAAGYGDWIKLEVINDSKYLFPDNYQTIKAAEVLVKLGFVVLPYINPDLTVSRALMNAGASAIMPLGAPIGSNRGLKMKELIKIIINEIKLPIIVDAGIGCPSDACEAMEIGAAACLVDTAVATSNDPVKMAKAFVNAVKAGREAYLAGIPSQEINFARPSSPLTGFLYAQN